MSSWTRPFRQVGRTVSQAYHNVVQPAVGQVGRSLAQYSNSTFRYTRGSIAYPIRASSGFTRWAMRSTGLDEQWSGVYDRLSNDWMNPTSSFVGEAFGRGYYHVMGQADLLGPDTATLIGGRSGWEAFRDAAIKHKGEAYAQRLLDRQRFGYGVGGLIAGRFGGWGLLANLIMRNVQWGAADLRGERPDWDRFANAQVRSAASWYASQKIGEQLQGASPVAQQAAQFSLNVVSNRLAGADWSDAIVGAAASSAGNYLGAQVGGGIGATVGGTVASVAASSYLLHINLEERTRRERAAQRRLTVNVSRSRVRGMEPSGSMAAILTALARGPAPEQAPSPAQLAGAQKTPQTSSVMEARLVQPMVLRSGAATALTPRPMAVIEFPGRGSSKAGSFLKPALDAGRELPAGLRSSDVLAVVMAPTGRFSGFGGSSYAGKLATSALARESGLNRMFA